MEGLGAWLWVQLIPYPGALFRLGQRIFVNSVGSTSTSWNASVWMATSSTEAASAAVPVRPHCGQAAMGNIQEMVGGPGRCYRDFQLGAFFFRDKELGARERGGEGWPIGRNSFSTPSKALGVES